MCLFQRSTIICLKASGRAVQRGLGNVPGSGNDLVTLRVHELNNSIKRSDSFLVTAGGLARLGLGPGVPRLLQAKLITGMFKGARF
jgi:predicted RNA-binding protein with PUA domain